MNMKIRTSYLSAAINQTNRSFDWNEHINLIVCAASNRMHFYDTQECVVVGSSIICHEKPISFVQWIKNDKFTARFLLTASSDGCVKIWEYKSSNNISLQRVAQCLTPFACLKGHNGSIACAHATILQDANEIFIATSGDDFLIKMWKLNIKTGEHEVFDYKLPGRSLALDILIIPCSTSDKEDTWPIVVYGGDDGKLHLMTSKDGKKYQTTCYLSGHQDWVTTLSYKIEGSGDILLASGSKDGMIRLWRLSFNPKKSEIPTDGVLEVKTIDVNVPKCAPINPCDVNGDRSEDCVVMSCSLESVLHGHEGLVSSLDWDYSQDETQRLLSCAKTEDRSVVIWEPNVDESLEYSDGTQVAPGNDPIWVEKARLGEVGGNREGFFRAQFGAGGKKIVATSYQGGLHLWHYIAGNWVPQPVVSGHFDEVVDLDWDSGGRYLMTVSKDQTTRLHAPIVHNSDQVKWQEIARPQVHGYDMACITCLDGFRFASAGEEKVVRGFTATAKFVRRLQQISNLDENFDDAVSLLPSSATVPSLGLSNKGENKTPEALVSNDEDSSHIHSVKDSELCVLPTEDELMMGTLWPEVSKLYGHGNELLALTSSHDSTLLASSCRATTDLDAGIILWNTKEWKEASNLSHHRLTVTQMEFSTCDQYLLSVSRDRSWAVWSRTQENEFSLLSHSGILSKKFQHTRIIWACAWVPKSRKFVTGSRDKTVAIWSPVSNGDDRVISWDRSFTFTEPEEVTAVAVTRIRQEQQENEKLLIAIGHATGSLTLKIFDEKENKVLVSSEVEISHRKAIRRLKFKPRSHLNCEILTLASCGNDNSVMLYEILI